MLKREFLLFHEARKRKKWERLGKKSPRTELQIPNTLGSANGDAVRAQHPHLAGSSLPLGLAGRLFARDLHLEFPLFFLCHIQFLFTNNEEFFLFYGAPDSFVFCATTSLRGTVRSMRPIHRPKHLVHGNFLVLGGRRFVRLECIN